MVDTYSIHIYGAIIPTYLSYRRQNKIGNVQTVLKYAGSFLTVALRMLVAVANRSEQNFYMQSCVYTIPETGRNLTHPKQAKKTLNERHAWRALDEIVERFSVSKFKTRVQWISEDLFCYGLLNETIWRSCPGRESNRAPPKQKSEVLPSVSTRSVNDLVPRVIICEVRN